jgi:hypothetical protein
MEDGGWMMEDGEDASQGGIISVGSTSTRGDDDDAFAD